MPKSGLMIVWWVVIIILFYFFLEKIDQIRSYKKESFKEKKIKKIEKKKNSMSCT